MKIVFATNNKHKLEEIKDILGKDFEIVSLAEIGCHEDIPETGLTLEENARQKSTYIVEHQICVSYYRRCRMLRSVQHVSARLSH